MKLDPSRGVLGIDIETASAHSIKFGPWAYSQSQSTRVYVVCLAYSERLGEYHKRAWFPGADIGDGVRQFVAGGGRLVAHNAAFEQSIWQNILTPQYGWPTTVQEQWRDTQQLGLAVNLPMALGGLAKALGCPAQKDTDGSALMKKMCIAHPTIEDALAMGARIASQDLRDVTLGDPARTCAQAQTATDRVGLYRHSRAQLKAGLPVTYRDALVWESNGYFYVGFDPYVRRLTAYCHDDVAATLDCYYRLPAMPPTEQQLALVDRRINARGVYVDGQFASTCARLANERAASLTARTATASGGDVMSATSSPQLMAWLRSRGVEIPTRKRRQLRGGESKVTASPSVDVAAVAEILDRGDVPDDVRSVLANRIEANKATSLAKLATVNQRVGADGRLRYALMSNGAHTGRWASMGMQLHNLPKDPRTPADYDRELAAILTGDITELEAVTDRPLVAISQSIRSTIAAAPGHELISADYSAIEARVIAWLAGQHDIVEQFERGRDVYVYTAAQLGSVNRQLGKVATLALGYGMGVITFQETAIKWGIAMTLAEARRLQLAWRKSNDKIVDCWAALETIARQAIETPGETFVAHRVAALVRSDCLLLVLPSGRALRYWRPHIVPTRKLVKIVTEEGEIVEVERTSQEIRFSAMGRDRSSMHTESTYAGKIAENVTQAIARDLLAEALIRIDGVDPYRLVIHVHDSAAAEVPTGEGSVDEFAALMSVCPAWARGLPLAAEGYRSRRFRG